VGHVLSHGLGGGGHIAQVGLAIHPRGRADGDEDELGPVQALVI
jgi:hypothetical protein